jgi:uncharacterized lipoprotein YajG
MKNKHHNLLLFSAVVIIFAATALLTACQASHGETVEPVPTASPQASPSPGPAGFCVVEHSYDNQGEQIP